MDPVTILETEQLKFNYALMEYQPGLCSCISQRHKMNHWALLPHQHPPNQRASAVGVIVAKLSYNRGPVYIE
jgi:hypothetical protein